MRQCKNNLTVTVDVQVLLRIAKHYKSSAPASVSGSLLGIDIEKPFKELRVTNSFGYKTTKSSLDANNASLVGGALLSAADLKGNSTPDDFTEFQYQVINTMAETRADANACGWYETTHHGNFLTEALIENQYAFQKEVSNAVVIVYDPFQLKVGNIGFKAYRLSDAAMKRRREAEDNEDEDFFASFPSDLLLEQVPIRVHVSPLVETLLLQYQTGGCNFEALDTDAISPSLERNVQLLLESLDEFSLQQREMQMYERQTRKAQKELQAKNQRIPKSVDTLNLSKQIQQHCQTIDEYAANSFGKLYMVSQTPDVKEVMLKLRGA